MGSVYRRNYIWWIQYYCFGKVYRESSRSKDKVEAFCLLRQREQLIEKEKIKIQKSKIIVAMREGKGMVNHVYERGTVGRKRKIWYLSYYSKEEVSHRESSFSEDKAYAKRLLQRREQMTEEEIIRNHGKVRKENRERSKRKEQGGIRTKEEYNLRYQKCEESYQKILCNEITDTKRFLKMTGLPKETKIGMLILKFFREKEKEGKVQCFHTRHHKSRWVYKKLEKGTIEQITERGTAASLETAPTLESESKQFVTFIDMGQGIYALLKDKDTEIRRRDKMIEELEEKIKEGDNRVRDISGDAKGMQKKNIELEQNLKEANVKIISLKQLQQEKPRGVFLDLHRPGNRGGSRR